MFANRRAAGTALARQLVHLRGDDVVVLGLPRGGVPVAAEVARALEAPLDVILVRKLGVPAQPEYAMGALGEGGVRVLSDEVVRLTGVTPADIAAVEAREQRELRERAARFRPDRDAIDLHGRVAVIVDDGIATGSTARAACAVARAAGASRIVLAVPVAPPDWTLRLAGCADELVCVETPDRFAAVGQVYDDFTQVGDDEVTAILDAHHEGTPGAPGISTPGETPVTIPIDGGALEGQLAVPVDPYGVVVFVHGSGSSRRSPRNRYVAEVLNDAGLATLLFDLLTPSEEQRRQNVFDVDLLAGRLATVTTWLRSQPVVARCPLGYFGASTGAAAALVAAANGAPTGAIVSRGGRPDLAGAALEEVVTPTLLIVGSRDRAVLDLNRTARANLGGESELVVVPGATHLFEEPGTLTQAAEAARDWFLRYLAGPTP